MDGCPEKRILLVDHDEAFGSALASVLGDGYALRHVARVADAPGILRAGEADVVLLNWDEPSSTANKGYALDLLQAVHAIEVAPPVLVYSWDTRRETAMEVMSRGALDFFTQPLSVLELRFAIDRACQRMALARELVAAQELIAARRVDGLLGNSRAMERVYEIIHKVAGVSTSVLLTGESGTGKDMVARAIHRLSPRADKPFVAFAACALPESLLEDELFGHEKGAFTGASQVRRGRFEEAQGGTIFLDEIGDLALPLQAKLLRVLQDRTMQRLGSNASIPLDVRVICATNRNLQHMVQDGTFRRDLYFRISVVTIDLPPLRERVDDIPLLADYFLRTFALVHNKDVRGISPAFLSALACHDWPGNVRELQNVIERSLVLADGPQLSVDDLPAELRGLAVSSEIRGGSFHEAVRSFKREIVRSALRLHGGNKLKAAQELRISRCYLHRLLNRFGIEDEMEGEAASEADSFEPEAVEEELVETRNHVRAHA